jgi:anti-sigma regulatory factor (Ser/Thr protein kinase)
MRELALHVLDVLCNAAEAGASRVTLTIEEDRAADLLRIIVADDGRGMDRETAARVLDPFYTTRTTRHVGLGLPLLAQAAEQAGGGLSINSEPGHGATVEATFQLSHPDRQPLGDMTGTLVAFLLSERAPELRYRHSIRRGAATDDTHAFEFDTTAIRAELDGVPLAHPLVARWLSEFISEGESELQSWERSFYAEAEIPG